MLWPPFTIISKSAPLLPKEKKKSQILLNHNNLSLMTKQLVWLEWLLVVRPKNLPHSFLGTQLGVHDYISYHLQVAKETILLFLADKLYCIFNGMKFTNQLLYPY